MGSYLATGFWLQPAVILCNSHDNSLHGVVMWLQKRDEYLPFRGNYQQNSGTHSPCHYTEHKYTDQSFHRPCNTSNMHINRMMNRSIQWVNILKPKALNIMKIFCGQKLLIRNCDIETFKSATNGYWENCKVMEKLWLKSTLTKKILYCLQVRGSKKFKRHQKSAYIMM